MNAFASKPLDLHALLWEVARLCGGDDGQPVALVTTDIEGDALFDWARGASLWGGPLRMAEAIAAFVRDQQDLVPRLSALLEAADWSGGYGAAHRFHGAAANLALTQLTQLGQALGEAFNAQDSSRLRTLLGELEQALQVVSERVPQVPDGTPPVSPSAVDPQALREAGDRLRQAVQRGGLDDEALGILEQGLAGARQAGVARVRQALDDFDFDQALDALDQVLQHLHDEEASA